MFAVAEHVHDDVAAELLAEPQGEVDDVDHRLGIVAVDVEDRRLDHLGDVGGVAGRAGLAGQCGETDLVVDHDVDRAAGLVALELGEVEGLGDESLSGERGVAVDQQRQDPAAGCHVVASPLLAPGSAFDDRVDGFEVSRVGVRLRWTTGPPLVS